MNDPTGITDTDMAAIRADGDLKAFLADIRKTATDRCATRRALVLRHPDLAKHLTDPPHRWTNPEHWNGYIPPAIWNGAPNNSPIRTALLDLVHEAEAREAPQTRAA